MTRLPVWQDHEHPSWQVTADMGPDEKRRLNRVRWGIVLVAAFVLAVSVIVGGMPKAFAASWTYYHPDGPTVTTVAGDPYVSSGRIYSSGNRTWGYPPWGGTYCGYWRMQGKAGSSGSVFTIAESRRCRSSYPSPGWDSVYVPYSSSFVYSDGCYYTSFTHYYRSVVTVIMGSRSVTHIGPWKATNCDAI